MIKLLGINLLLICFFHGVFASGFMPILSSILKEDSSLAFTLYFIGILLGQTAVFLFGKISKHKLLYPIYEIGFSLALIIMAFFLSKFGLSIGRFAEGFFAGLAIPMLFSILVKLNGFFDLGKRVVMFNSIFSLGFVLGTPLVEVGLKITGPYIILTVFGSILIILSMLLFIANLPEIKNSTMPALKELFSLQSLKERFLSLLLSKIFYGFLLGTITAHRQTFIPQYTITEILLSIAAVFILGQFLTERVTKVFPQQHIETLSPVFISLFLILFFNNKEWALTILLFASFFHSTLLFIAFKNLGSMPSGARSFALYNAITDIGMVVGSFLSFNPSYGVYIFGGLSVIPLVIYILENHSKVRAERLFPFVGPITLLKVIYRQKNPLKENIDFNLSDYFFDKQIFESQTSCKLLFFGDLAPTKINYHLSEALEQLISKHDLCYFNLEGTQTDKVYSNKNRKLLFDIPDEQINTLLSNINNKAFTIVNNHIFDRGISTFSDTLNKYSLKDRPFITSKGSIRNLNGLLIGELAISYGANIPWSKHSDVLFIKPAQLLDANHTKTLELTRRINNLKKSCDFLVLSYHWGYECEYWPSALQQKVSKVLKEMGIDLLYGHHSHIAQGYSVDNNFISLFSLGNFVSNMNLPIYQQGIAYSISLFKDQKGVRVSKIEPCFLQLNPELKVVDIIAKDISLAYKNFSV